MICHRSFVTERDEERVQKIEARIGIKLGSPRRWEVDWPFDLGTQSIEMSLPE